MFAQGKNIIYDEEEYCLPIESNISKRKDEESDHESNDKTAAGRQGWRERQDAQPMDGGAQGGTGSAGTESLRHTAAQRCRARRHDLLHRPVKKRQ